MLYLRCRLKDFSFTCSKRCRAAWHRLCLTLQNLTRRDGTWEPMLTFCLSWRYFKTRVASLTPSQLWASLSVNNCSFLCLSTHDTTPVLIAVPLSFSFQSTYLAVPSMFFFFPISVCRQGWRLVCRQESGCLKQSTKQEKAHSVVASTDAAW